MFKPTKKKVPKTTWQKIWYFIWDDDSVWSWIVNVVIAFVLIKYLIYPGLGFAFGTTHPVVAVVSGSMEHKIALDSRGNLNLCGTYYEKKEAVDYDFYWDVCGSFYGNHNITKDQFSKFIFKSGFNTGDIIVLIGKNPDKIDIGDVIVFRSQQADPIIHRVIHKWKEGDKTYFTTKGDHNAGIIEDVFVVQSGYTPTTDWRLNDNLVELCFTIQAAMRASARSATAVILDFPYARSERRTAKQLGIRKSIGAKYVADSLIDSGTSGLITLDIHAESIEVAFPNDFGFDNIFPTPQIINRISSVYRIEYENCVVSTLDEGGVKRSSIYAAKGQKELIIIAKERDHTSNKVKRVKIIGDPQGKYVFIVDDILATGGSLEEGINALMEKGALGVIFGCSIPLMVEPAIERLDKLYNGGKGPLLGVVAANSVWHGENFSKLHPWMQYVDMAPTLSDVIATVSDGGSLHALLD